MVGSACHASHRAPQEVLLVRADDLDADRLLELEHQPGADRFDDRRGAALLALRRVGRGSDARSG